MRHAQNAAAQGASQIVFATASYDHTVRFWEIHSGKSWLTIKQVLGVRVWCSHSLFSSLRMPETQVNAMVLSPEQRDHLACATNPSISVFDLHGDVSAPVLSYTGHTGNVTALGYHKEGKWLYSAGEDKTVKIWDVRAAGCQREMENAAPVNTAALHPNQVELVYGDQSGYLKVWDLRTNTCTRALVPSGKLEVPLRSITISANGKRIVAANNKGQCFVWRLAGEDTSVFEPYTKIDAHSTYITSVRVSPDCKLVATAASDNTVKIFDMKAFRLVQTLTGHTDWVWDAQWSADSSMLATCSSDNSARLWSVATGDVMREYTEHSKTVSAMVLHEKGTPAAAAN
jgi:G protein beta subunit-like protein